MYRKSEKWFRVSLSNTKNKSTTDGEANVQEAMERPYIGAALEIKKALRSIRGGLIPLPVIMFFAKIFRCINDKESREVIPNLEDYECFSPDYTRAVAKIILSVNPSRLNICRQIYCTIRYICTHTARDDISFRNMATIVPPLGLSPDELEGHNLVNSLPGRCAIFKEVLNAWGEILSGPIGELCQQDCENGFNDTGMPEICRSYDHIAII